MKKIPLTQGKFALVDDDSYKKLSVFRWSLDGSGYPQTNRKTEKGWIPIRMHRFLLNLVGSQAADHINGDKLDNRLENLRLCSQTENNRNRGKNKNNKSGFKGVHYNRKRGVFQAYITVNRKHKFVGAFDTAVRAARAYDEAASKIHGEFARVNFPKQNTPTE